MLVDDNYIYIVTNETTQRSLVRYTLDGKNKKVLTEKLIVNNIVMADEYIYYTNSSDKNRVYRVNINGSENTKVTNNSCIFDTSRYNGNNLITVYGGRVIYINSQDNKIYVVNDKIEQLLIDNEVKSIQLKEKMLYIALKNKIEIHRYNLEKNELQKITSARFSEFVFANN